MSRKFVHLLIWGLPLVLVMGACSSAESSRAKPERSDPTSAEKTDEERTDRSRVRGERRGPPADVVSRLIQEALQSDGNVSYSTLVQQLGRPKRVETEPVANQYVEDQIDTLRTLVYRGVEAMIYDVANDSKTFLVRLSLSTARYTTPDGLRVGLTKERVIDRLGPPTRRNTSTGELVYQETTPKPTSMLIQLRNDRVTRIDWEFSVT